VKILNHLDLGQSELRNAALQVLSAAPSSPVIGQGYFNSTTKQALHWSGTAWVNNATDSALFNGQNAAFYLARVNMTGTQLAATISDLATTVQAYRLDQFAAPTALVNYNSQRITGLADPVNPQDAATMTWVQGRIDLASAAIDSKPSVRVVAVANVALTGIQTIDSILLVAGDRVLLTAQTVASQNGVWIVAAGAWTRATDADVSGELTPGAFWMVEEGATKGASQWRCNNVGAIVVGTTAITINQWGQQINYTANNGVQLVGSNFSAQVVAGGGILAGASGIQIDTAVVARKFSQAIGDGSTTSIVVTHNLATQDVAVTVRDTSGNIVFPDVQATNANAVTISFAVAPALNAYRVTVVG
jgi:hypothetical protein